ncbi:glutamate receptor ionotropic, delta-1-like [Palaemon carinicauda]|uniref:glutamate receptor ionotropic, delta-1-like n=1 Tax=Palaemon carinicauda TaxID=392227 RepID=UPI0035B65F07
MKVASYVSRFRFLQLCVVFLHGVATAESFQSEQSLGEPLVKKYAANEGSEGMNELQEVIGEVIEDHFPDCHLLVIKETDDVNMDFFLRNLQMRNRPFVLVTRLLMMQVIKESQTAHLSDYFLIGRKTTGCRAVVVYLPDSSNSIFSNFLQILNISKNPYIKVLGIGLPGGERDFLMSHALRNTIHALYFSMVLSSREGQSPEAGLGNRLVTSQNREGSIRVYLRCLFCDAGNSQVILTDTWFPKTGWKYERNFFPDQFKNFNGHTLRMAVKSFFPFADFIPDTDEPGSSVQFVDCLEVRMLREMARKLNLTFRAFLSVDDEWGQPIGNGSWTGLVAAMMKEDADFGTCLFPSAKRNAVVDFTRMYAPEPFLIVTLKPQLLPRYLAIIRPFTMTMWAAVVASSVVVGLSFWVLHKGWLDISSRLKEPRQGRDMGPPEESSISHAIFYTWGLLFQQTPFKNPSYFFGRLWLACWMIFSFLILTTYKSALIASLSVPQMSEAVDSIPQLLNQKGWTWGMEPHYSVGWQFLTESTNPDNQMVAKTLGVRDIADEMKLVSKGKHAFFTWKNYVKSFIAAEYTDKNGYTPMHISRQHYLETSGSYWGCRKGAPFLRTIIDIKQHLFEGHLLELWLNQIFRETATRARDKKGDTAYVQEDRKQIVLSLNHLQGAFYAYFIGQLLALLALITECLQKRCLTSN